MCDLNPDSCGYCFEGICDLKTDVFIDSESIKCYFKVKE